MTIFNGTFATNSTTAGEAGKGGLGTFPGNDGARGLTLSGNLARISGRFFLRNTILAGGGAGGNCYGTVGDVGYNLSSDSTARFTTTGSRNNRNPLLGTHPDNSAAPKT